MNRRVLKQRGVQAASAGGRWQGSRAAAIAPRQPARPVVALFGEWNTSNLGDRAIHREAVRFYAECGWRVRSFAFGSLCPVETHAAPDAAERSQGVRARLLGRLRPGPRRFLRGLRQRYRMRNLLRELAGVQAVAIGGGALLSDHNLHFPQSLSVVAGAGRRLGLPLYCLGCSAEGAWSASGAGRIREALRTASLISVRDASTAARVEALMRREIGVFGDFCLNERVVRLAGAHRGPRDAWAINVSRLPEPWDAMQQQYEDALVGLGAACRRRAAGNGMATLRIFTTGTAADADPARRVFSRLAGTGVELRLPDGVDELTGMLRASGLVFASRLHAAVLALGQGAPVIACTPVPKVHKFFATIGLARFSSDWVGAEALARWHQTGGAAIFEHQLEGLARSPLWPEQERVRRLLMAEAETHARRAYRCA